MFSPPKVEADVEVIHGDVGGVGQVVDLEGESVGVARHEEDDDAHQHDRRLLATFLQVSANILVSFERVFIPTAFG